MASNNETTHIRAPKSARKRIAKLGKTLAATVGGDWKSPAVVDRALDCLERNVADAAKAQATETPAP